MSTTTKKNNMTYWIHLAVWLVLSFIGWILPPGEIITSYGMKILFIFIGLMYGWIFLDLVFPSLLSVVLAAFAGGGAVANSFYSGFGSNVVVIIIILTTLCQYVNYVGLDLTIAKWFTNLKVLNGKPWLFITMFMLLVYVFGYFINAYAVIFVMWAVTYAICEELGYEKRSSFAGYMLFGVAYICGVGMLAKPFDAWAMIGLNPLSDHLNGYMVNYVLYTVYMLIVGMLTLASYLFIGKFMLKIDVEPLRTRNVETTEKIMLTKDQKRAGAFMLAFLVLMYLPSLLPTDWTLYKVLKQLDVIGVGALVLVVMGAWRSNSEKITDVGNLATKGVPFAIIFLMVANTVVAAGLKSSDAGIVAWIGQVVGPLVSGLSPIIFYIALIVLYGVLTQFMHNVVLLAMFTPIALTFSDLIGANPILVTFIGIVMLSVALATAGASSRSGLVFGNTEWIDPKHAYYLGVTSVIMAMAVMAIVGIPLGLVMFPM